jgi:anti-sigma regulatory factor (Ser/Thr protein kinase)
MATEASSQLLMPAALEHLPDLNSWIERLAAEFSLPATLVHRIDVCLTELVTNVISYGYPDGQVGAIQIQFWRQTEQIVIRIDDDGTLFDPTSYETPGLPTSLADAPGGGRGIRLVRHFSDELHHSAGATGNQVTLVLRGAGSGTHSPAPLSAPHPAGVRSR